MNKPRIKAAANIVLAAFMYVLSADKQFGKSKLNLGDFALWAYVAYLWFDQLAPRIHTKTSKKDQQAE